MLWRRSIRGTALTVLVASLLAAQPAILQISVVEGDGAVHTVGSRSSRPLSVRITDETGAPVEGAAVSFQLPETGTSGTFPNGLRTEIVTTGPDGRASVRGIRWNSTSGAFQIRITAAKGTARAVMLSEQHIEGSARIAAPRGKRGRWIVLGLAAGAAAAGLAIGLGGGNGTPSSPQPPVIGAPTISVGAP